MLLPRTIRYTRTPISGMNSTNRNHTALPPPDRSWLRKMSMNTVIRIQNQITNRKIFQDRPEHPEQRVGVGTRSEQHGVSLARGRLGSATGGCGGERERHDRTG